MPTAGVLLSRAAQRYPERTALICGKTSRTYREVDANANRIANTLRSSGLQEGARVALLRENSIAFAEDEFGVLKVGMAEVPVNPRLSVEEQRRILTDAEAGAVIVGDEFADRASSFAGVPSLSLLIGNDEERQRLMASASDVAPVTTIGDGDLWRLHYSSGTTGEPKAAALMQKNFQLCVQSVLGLIGGASPNSVLLDVAPMQMSGGWIYWGHYLSGSRTVIMPRFEPQEFVELAQQHGATTTLLVPSMVNRVVDELQRTHERVPLETVVYTAAPIASSRLAAALEVLGPVMVQAYSMSETMSALSILSKQDHLSDDPDRLLSAGVPALDVDIRLLNPDGTEVRPGEVGQVVIRTDAIMRGYWRRDDLNARTLRDGWLYSRDLGRLDERGYLYIVDRLDDVIVSGGFNVYPREVEDVICRHEAVAEAAVFGVPDERFGEAVKAVVTLRPGKYVTEAELIEFCRGPLGFKKPRSVELTTEPLPKNTGGKILRRVLRDKYWQGQVRQIS